MLLFKRSVLGKFIFDYNLVLSDKNTNPELICVSGYSLALFRYKSKNNPLYLVNQNNDGNKRSFCLSFSSNSNHDFSGFSKRSKSEM